MTWLVAVAVVPLRVMEMFTTGTAVADCRVIEVIVCAPLYAEGVAPAMVTESPTLRLMSLAVVTVAVVLERVRLVAVTE